MKCYFDEAARSLKQGNWNASGAMSRKTLYTATKAIIRKMNRENLAPLLQKMLKARIKAIGEKGLLTADLIIGKLAFWKTGSMNKRAKRARLQEAEEYGPSQFKSIGLHIRTARRHLN
jgi:hypothetical protein